jgi:hypothetical protein
MPHFFLPSAAGAPSGGAWIARISEAIRASAFLRFALAATLGATPLRAVADPVINEFMASNKTGLVDIDGAHSDWVELYNPAATPINLEGWSLTDDPTDKTQWRLPAVTLAAGGYLVVFASGKDRADPTKELHTNFSLGAGGEYLALVKPDGTTVASSYDPEYPEQDDDVSYGLPAGASMPAFLGSSTPGAANSPARPLRIDQTVSFSRPSGLFADNLTLTLTGAGANQTIRYTRTDPSAAGAIASEPTRDSPEYAGAIVLDSSAMVRAAVFSTDGLARGPIATAQFVRYENSGAKRVDNLSSNLPLLVIDSHGLGPMVKDGIDRPAWIYGFAPAADQAATLTEAATFSSPLEFAVRGTASTLFPKQSFKLKLVDTAGKKQPLAPFGLGRFDKWQLIGPWGFDRSFIRNAFIYALSNRIGLWAPRTRFVEVLLNKDEDGLTADDYAGIYVLTDKIEPGAGRVPIAELDDKDISAPDVSGGYIVKIDWVEDSDYSWRTAGGVTVILDTPDVDDVVPEQALYVEQYVQQFEDALFRDIAIGWTERAYLNFINRDSWIDFHLLNTFTKNVDAFAGSTFFTKDRNGKLSAGPLWDFDRSMGSYDERNDAWDQWRSSQDGGDGWYSQWWGKLVLDPAFMQGWIDRWQNLRRNEFSDANLVSLADELAAPLGVGAAARDVARYPGNASEYPNGYAGEIAHLKDWLVRRAGWIDQQFTAAPTVVTQAGQVTITAPAGANLVYTRDGSDPRTLNGGVATGAVETAGPLVLPESATYSVRARNSGAVRFPATPWSRALTVIGEPPPVLPALQPATSAIGRTVIFSAGDAPGDIRWQISTDGGSTWANLADGADYSGSSTATLTILAARESLGGARFRYTTTYRGSAYSSNAVMLTVTPILFPFPTGIALDAEGNILVADASADAVGRINSSGQVRMLTGTGGPRPFNRPEGILVPPEGGLVVADTANDAIRRVGVTGGITTLAGRPGVRGHADGAADIALFSSPRDVARDATGALFIADAMNHVIRRVAPDGTVSTFAGTPGVSGTDDGHGGAARFNHPSALAATADGILFVSDTINHTIRRITATGEVTTFAGLRGVGGSENGRGNLALFNQPGGLGVDSAGNVFVADTGNSTIRRIAPDGTVTTLAGVAGISGVANGKGSDALFNQPRDLVVAANGNLWVADTGNALIRRIAPDGEVSTLVLSAAPADPGDGPGPGDPNPPAPPSSPDDDPGPGGGGAPSLGFFASLAALALARLVRRPRRGSN